MINIDRLVSRNNYIYFCGNFVGLHNFNPMNGGVWFNTMYGGIVGDDGYVVKLNNCLLSAPRAENLQSYCQSLMPTVANLQPHSPTIQWFADATSSTPLSSTELLVNNENYFAERVAGSCPGVQQRRMVTVNLTSSPPSPVAANQQFCKASNPTIANLLAIGTDIKWYESPTSGDALNANAALVDGKTYYATQYLNGCESVRTPVTVTLFNTVPVVTTPQQEFCKFSSPTLSNLVAPGNLISYYSTPTGTATLPLSTPLTDGHTYYVTQNINGCESEVRTAITVSLKAIPAPLVSSPQTLCSDLSPTFGMLNAAGQNIKWYNTAAGGAPVPLTTALSAGTYYASQEIDGCESIDRQMVVVNIDNTNFVVKDYSDNICDTGSNNSEVANLNNYLPFMFTTATGYSLSFHRTISGASAGTDFLINASSVTLMSGLNTFYLRVVSPGGCIKTGILNVMLYSNSPVAMAENYTFCENDDIEIFADPGYSFYEWSTGATTPSVRISQPGNYWVKLKKMYGSLTCESIHNFTALQANLPKIKDIITRDWTSVDNSFIIDADGTGNMYSLDGLNFQSDNYFSNLSPGMYDIYVKNNCGAVQSCAALLYYPAFFSPNGDGHNENWHIKYAFIEKDMQVKIYDRFGKFIHAMDGDDAGWNGTYNGRDMPATDYWFTVTRANGKLYRGHFSLIR